jgi:hypothetical protein
VREVDDEENRRRERRAWEAEVHECVAPLSSRNRVGMPLRKPWRMWSGGEGRDREAEASGNGGVSNDWEAPLSRKKF